MKTNLVRICAIVVLLGVAFLLMGAVNKHSQPKQQCSYVIGYEVKAGDTLWNIAQKYEELQDKEIREFIFDIRQYNGGISPIIYPGQVIEIPIQKTVENTFSITKSMEVKQWMQNLL